MTVLRAHTAAAGQIRSRSPVRCSGVSRWGCSATARDPALTLSRNHRQQIAQAFGNPNPWVQASWPFQLLSPTAPRRAVLKCDPCAKRT